MCFYYIEGFMLTSLVTFLLICIQVCVQIETCYLDMNWLQAAKELVKLNTWQTLGVIFKERLFFQPLQNLWMAKALMASYIHCKILMLHKKYSIHQVRIHWQSKSYYDLWIFRTDLLVVCIENKNRNHSIN